MYIKSAAFGRVNHKVRAPRLLRITLRVIIERLPPSSSSRPDGQGLGKGKAMRNDILHYTKQELDAGVPKGWRWKHFTPNELRSKGDGSLLINCYAMDCLQLLRVNYGLPIRILSAYRDPEYNLKVGGARKSLHMQGRAFDINMVGRGDSEVINLIYWATHAGFNGFGLYLSRGFLHIDVGPHRVWQEGSSRLDDSDDVTEHP